MPRFVVGLLALSALVGAACASFSSTDAPAANGSDASSNDAAADSGSDAPTAPEDAGPPPRLFVIGGATDTGVTKKTYIGTIAPGGIDWRPGPPLGTAVASGCAAALGDRIHLVGGYDIVGAATSGALMRPDDVVPKWTADVAPADLRVSQGCAVDRGRLYVTGGEQVHASPKVTTEVAAAGVDGDLMWSAGTNLLGGIQDHASAIVSGRLFVLGNSFPCSSQISAASILADGGLAAWTDAGALRETGNQAAVVSLADRIYLVGGYRGSGCGSASDSIDVLLIDPTGTVRGIIGDRLLPETRTNHQAAIVGGRLYVLGGNVGVSTIRTRSVISAVVRADQTLGPWKEESSLPVAVSRFALAVY